MAVLEKFLGKRVEIPEDLRYQVKQGLWAQKQDMNIVFGLTQPALVLMGGVKDIEALVNDGTIVNPGDSVLFAITKKILYIDVPVCGAIQYNKKIQENPAQIGENSYGDGWLFMIQPQDDIDKSYLSLASSKEYIQSLSKTEGLKNPLGLKGGVSGMCKAVYSGIGEQNL
jgi:glycine cleavage system H lipoate-binding protein